VLPICVVLFLPHTFVRVAHIRSNYRYVQERFAAFVFFGLHAGEPLDCSFFFKAGPLNVFPTCIVFFLPDTLCGLVLVWHTCEVIPDLRSRGLLHFSFCGLYAGKPFDCSFFFKVVRQCPLTY